MDTYQSAQIKQQLQADKFNTSILSVDRLENVPGTNTKVCLPYAFFRSAIYEKRLDNVKFDNLKNFKYLNGNITFTNENPVNQNSNNNKKESGNNPNS